MDDRFGALDLSSASTQAYLKKGDTILNSFTGKTERIGRMVKCTLMTVTRLVSAQAGDIIAIVGMKNVQTGHTLCDPKIPRTLEPMVFPEPVISISVTPKDKGGSEKMGIAIGKMVAEDPPFRLKPTKIQAKPSLKVWASFTLTLKSTS